MSDGDNIVWGVDGDQFMWDAWPIAHQPATPIDWYLLFLNRKVDVWWVAREFGDSFSSRDGRPVPKPWRAPRLRRLTHLERHE